MNTPYSMTLALFDIIDGLLTMMSKHAVKVDGRRMVDLNRITPDIVDTIFRVARTDFNDDQPKTDYALTSGQIRSYLKPSQKVDLFKYNNTENYENK
jgi:hypothetical protein